MNSRAKLSDLESEDSTHGSFCWFIVPGLHRLLLSGIMDAIGLLNLKEI